jgi:hypothetical protein
MDFEINKNIYAHDLINPPTLTNSCNITLEFNAPNCLLRVEKGELSYSTEYLLRADKALELGFTSCEQSIFISEFQNLILALNINLRRVCVTREDIRFLQGGINIKPPESRANTEKDGNRTTVTIEETIVFRDEVHTSVGLSEKISCQEVIHTFQKLQHLTRFNTNKARSLELSNFIKALREYGDAMSALSRPVKFKHLFNALELVSNIDGSAREKENFDSRVASLSGVKREDIREWREFYNRTKHVDKHSTDVHKYVTGMKGIGSKYILPLRSCCNGILSSVLQSRI